MQVGEMNQMFTPTAAVSIHPVMPRVGTPSKSPRPPVATKTTEPVPTPKSGTDAGLAQTLPVAHEHTSEMTANSSAGTPAYYDTSYARHDFGDSGPSQAGQQQPLHHADAHLAHAAQVMGYGPLQNAHLPMPYGSLDPHGAALSGMAPGMPHLGLAGTMPMAALGGMALPGMFPHLNGMMGMPPMSMYSGMLGSPGTMGLPVLDSLEEKTEKNKKSKTKGKPKKYLSKNGKADSPNKKNKSTKKSKKDKIADTGDQSSDSDSESGEDSTKSSSSSDEESAASSSIVDEPIAKKAKNKTDKSAKSYAEKGNEGKESKTKTALEDPSIQVELAARKEHEWEVEKKKRELAFNDMSKDLRDELRTMRDKYENIVKFDSAIHISLEEHRERMKLKQDECDHYIDSKLYEKQKIFDREVADIKLKSQESDDNYTASLDSYKEIVKKLDSECHRLEAGWADTRKQLSDYKEEVIANNKELRESHKVTCQELEQKYEKDTTELRDEINRMKEEYEADIAKRNEEKEAQDTEMRIVKNINMDKLNANKKLVEDLKISEEALMATKEKAVAAMFRLKTVTNEKETVEAQLDRLKDAAVGLKRDLNAANSKYDEIVLWAKNTENAQRKHDEEMKKNMNEQHSKFNVEYDFLAKQNSALKDEIRTLKNEKGDLSNSAAAALDKMKELQRTCDDRVRKEKIAAEHAEKLQVQVDTNEKKFDMMQKKLELIRDRDLRLQATEMNQELSSLKKKVEVKTKLVEEMENKTDFLRNKVKNLEDAVVQKGKKIDALEEQVAFETRMREINIQKRLEHENGGIDAVVSLLRINEMNAANLDRITETNANNLDVVRQDIAKLVTRINTETVERKKVNARNKMEAVAEMVKMGHKLHEEQKIKEELDNAGLPKRPIDMNQASLHMARSMSPDKQEAIKFQKGLPEQPDGIYKDGHGRPILDPFHPSLGKSEEELGDRNNENSDNNQKPEVSEVPPTNDDDAGTVKSKSSTAKKSKKKK